MEEIKWENLIEATEDMVVIEVIADTVAVVLEKERCIKQLVLNVIKNVKFLLNHQATGLFTAETVTEKEDQEGFR